MPRMTALSLTALLLLSAAWAEPAPTPSRAPLAPAWKMGDVFRVEYHRRVVKGSGQVCVAPVRQADEVYVIRYEVTGREKTKEGRTRTVIRASDPITRRVDFQLVFQEDPLLLVEARSLAKTPYTGPEALDFFEANPVMLVHGPYLGQGLRIILDFPRLADASLEDAQDIALKTEHPWMPPFTQTLLDRDSEDGRRIEARLTRSISGKKKQESIQVWEAGKKWWSKAEVRVNGEEWIRGNLLEGRDDEEAAEKEKAASAPKK